MRPELTMLIACIIFFVTGACSPQGEETAKAPTQEEEAVKTVNLDRRALVDLMTDYFDALVSKDTSKVPIAANVKFVENTAEIPVGDGLWVTAAGGPGEFRVDAADPEVQQVTSLAMMKEYEGEDALASIIKTTIRRTIWVKRVFLT